MKNTISILLLSFFAASAAHADMLVCNMSVERLDSVEYDGTGSDSLPLRTLLETSDYSCSANVESEHVMEYTLTNVKRDISRFTRNQAAVLVMEDKYGNFIEKAVCECKFR